MTDHHSEELHKKKSAAHGDHDNHNEHLYGPDLAMGFIRPDNLIRKKLSDLLHHRTYENFIVILIFVSAI